MQIDFLDEIPEAIDTLAPAFWAEWGVHDSLTLEQVKAKLVACLRRDALPLALVAREGTELLGSVGLHDSPVVGRNGLGPWLVALWVDPKHRRQGLGAELIAAAERTAIGLGIEDLYAATSTAVRLFERAGWGEIERFEHRYEELALFHRQLVAGRSTEDELMQVTADWDRAMITNDADAIGRFMSDDWVIIGTDGSVDTKARFLGLVRSGIVTHDVMETHEVDIRVYGNSAVVIGRGVSGGAYQGQTFLLNERVTSVFVREGGEWRCVSTHLSSLGPSESS